MNLTHWFVWLGCKQLALQLTMMVWWGDTYLDFVDWTKSPFRRWTDSLPEHTAAPRWTVVCGRWDKWNILCGTPCYEHGVRDRSAGCLVHSPHISYQNVCEQTKENYFCLLGLKQLTKQKFRLIWIGDRLSVQTMLVQKGILRFEIWFY